jgi:hypothetical protein
MIIQIIVGALATLGTVLLIDFARKNSLTITWWQWVLTGLGILYGVFVLEVIIGFLGEGAPQAALVMGLITGIVAVIWGVLLGRFVFKKA